ncbi:MAG: SxtJ family membrane protein [Glaciecola sp.]|nr:SxtJ family membrane protein [Glaciecola sp.]
MPKISLLTQLKRIWQRIALPMLTSDARKGMRDFAWQFSLLISIVFMGVLPWLFDENIPYWPLGLSVYLCASGIIYPKAVYPIYVGWMIIASVLGFINTYLLLALVFYVIFTPIGWILRLTKGLQYDKYIKQPSTYYITRDKPLDKSHLTKPF